MKMLIALLLCLLKVNFSFTQQVTVINIQQNIVYCGIPNYLSALAQNYPCKSIILTTDNGRIEKAGCSFTYRPSIVGSSEIKAWVKKDKRLKLIGATMYRARPLPIPITFIGSNRGGYISLKVLKAPGGLRAYIPGTCSEATPVYIISYTATAIRDTTFLFKNNNAGAVYNDALRSNLDSLKAGDSFLVSNIVCKGPDGKEINPSPMEFFIKN